MSEIDAESEAFLSNHAVRLLRVQNDGRTIDELDESIKEVVRAACATNKKGKVSLTLDIDPSADGEQVTITATVDSKVPKPVTPARIYFASEEGTVSREHPNQLSLLR